MGKKGKKKGGSGKGKKKKDVAPTFRETFLAYQISLKAKEVEEYRFEVERLSDRTEKLKDRNQVLEIEGEVYLERLLEHSREKRATQRSVTTREVIVEALLRLWREREKQRRLVRVLEDALTKSEANRETVLGEVTFWREYKEKGVVAHETQIKLLEEELVAVDEIFKGMAEFVESGMVASRAQIEDQTTNAMKRQKEIAADYALSKLDSRGRGEVEDHRWLRCEADIYRREVSSLRAQVEEAEQQNLELLAQLFDCRIEDLHVARNIFLTTFNDGEEVENNCMLQIDLDEVKLMTRRKSRPKSAIHQAVEERLRAAEEKSQGFREPTEEEEEGLDDGDVVKPMATEATLSSIPEVGLTKEDLPHTNVFNKEATFLTDKTEEFMSLGPLELKLLSLAGRKVELGERPNILPDEPQPNTYQWPTRKQIDRQFSAVTHTHS